LSQLLRITIEDWDGDGAIRIPDAALQELGVDVGDSVFLIEEYVGNNRCLILSKTPKIPHRIDELVEAWDVKTSTKD
jgi:antitoxin component of MazEF toxin-antitoxin module